MIRLAVVLLMLGACSTTMTPQQAADHCEKRARDAQGPTGGVTFGVNNKSGAFTEAEIGISSDFLRGADPDVLYDRCVIEITGEGPIRRPVLRNM
ncbi:hypothetical protein [Yoonia sp. MH D7]